MKDILVFLSDQHSPLFSEYAGGPARTPTLNRLCAEGTSYTSCYTSCPLCVPARMSMLTGRLPSKTGVMRNNDTIPDVMPTFLHPFVAAGYETVLIGRMHFVGKDQRHGFTKRLAQDMTPVTWNRPVQKLREERGVFNGTYDAKGCIRVIGGGDSPVLQYDEYVVQTALQYLREEHEKPQLIVVGTYAPHFPYVAPPELFREYEKIAKIPPMFHETPDYMNPLLQARKNVVNEETVLAAQAAYMGMITYTDEKIAQVEQAFCSFVKRRGSESLMCYLSDHGDQVGARDLFGKCTFFEASARIPFILKGTGIEAGKQITAPCSIMDLGPTLCEWAEVEGLRNIDGVSILHGGDENRIVFSEMIEAEGEKDRVGLMARSSRWKYMSYSGYEDQDVLFDMAVDQGETVNAASNAPEILKSFQRLKKDNYDFSAIEKEQSYRTRIAEWMKAWERETGINEDERWQQNTAKDRPEICKT